MARMKRVSIKERMGQAIYYLFFNGPSRFNELLKLLGPVYGIPGSLKISLYPSNLKVGLHRALERLVDEEIVLFDEKTRKYRLTILSIIGVSNYLQYLIDSEFAPTHFNKEKIEEFCSVRFCQGIEALGLGFNYSEEFGGLETLGLAMMSTLCHNKENPSMKPKNICEYYYYSDEEGMVFQYGLLAAKITQYNQWSMLYKIIKTCYGLFSPFSEIKGFLKVFARYTDLYLKYRETKKIPWLEKRFNEIIKEIVHTLMEGNTLILKNVLPFIDDEGIKKKLEKVYRLSREISDTIKS